VETSVSADVLQFWRALSAAKGRQMTLSEKELTRYKRSLIDMRDRLKGELRTIEETTQFLGDQDELSHLPTHPADRVSEGVEKQLAVAKTESELLTAVYEALERMDQGDYGVCEHCGGPIGYERLEALPYAAHCVRCEEQLSEG
jgi:RNA polymerase-binding protein DksA